MPEGVSDAMVSGVPRRRRSLRTLVLAALLAALMTLLGAGVASADYWPHTEQGSPVAAERG